MVTCDKCGEKLKKNAKFCNGCGDAITWPENKATFAEHADKLTDFLKESGNDFLDDNLPEEYAEKVRGKFSNVKDISNDPERSFIDENEKLSDARENIINKSKSIKDSTSSFLSENESLNNAKDTVLSTGESVKESGSNFINNNVSSDTQDKIKSNFNNFSDSTIKFTSKTSNVLKNIHSHRSKVKKQKMEERELKKQQEAAEKEELDKKRHDEYLEMQKQRQIQKEKDHKNTIAMIRQTRIVNISFPRMEQTDNVATGAMKGEMIGSAAGRAMEGFFGSKDSLSGTLNAGLVIGGAGALLGGLAASADDGLRWDDAQLYIGDDELIIAGKFTLPFEDIKLISTGRFKDYEMVVLTLTDDGVEFSTEDALALKIVIDEYMKHYFETKQKPSNVDELLKYGELYEKGVITKEELDLKKKELL